MHIDVGADTYQLCVMLDCPLLVNLCPSMQQQLKGFAAQLVSLLRRLHPLRRLNVVFGFLCLEKEGKISQRLEYTSTFMGYIYIYIYLCVEKIGYDEIGCDVNMSVLTKIVGSV